ERHSAAVPDLPIDIWTDLTCHTPESRACGLLRVERAQLPPGRLYHSRRLCRPGGWLDGAIPAYCQPRACALVNVGRTHIDVHIGWHRLLSWALLRRGHVCAAGNLDHQRDASLDAGAGHYPGADGDVFPPRFAGHFP